MKLICKLSDDDSFILEESKIINLNASKDFMYTFSCNVKVLTFSYGNAIMTPITNTTLYYKEERVIQNGSN